MCSWCWQNRGGGQPGADWHQGPGRAQEQHAHGAWTGWEQGAFRSASCAGQSKPGTSQTAHSSHMGEPSYTIRAVLSCTYSRLRTVGACHVLRPVCHCADPVRVRSLRLMGLSSDRLTSATLRAAFREMAL